MRRLNMAFRQPIIDVNARPRIERPRFLTALCGGPLTFVDEIGGRWDVFDLIGIEGDAPHLCRSAPAPSTWAAHRVFRYRDGTLRVYSFSRGERRDFTKWREQRLQSQLERAQRFNLPDGVSFTGLPWDDRRPTRTPRGA